MVAINTTGLSFSYRDTFILDSVDLSVPRGCIYGYLGKNGEGKTTTIKLLAGLLKPLNGIIHFDSKIFNKNRTDILLKTGFLIEHPSLYHNLTVYENLKYLDSIYKFGESRIQETLSLIGLKSVWDRKVKFLSTGMKQRLGIGVSLLHDPDILIWDEPLNGLDAEGIYMIRELILELNTLGKTIFLSSHILSELEKVCTYIGILNKGKLIFQGKIQELFKNIPRVLTIKVDNIQKAISICKENLFKVLDISESFLKLHVKTEMDFNELLRLFVLNEIKIYDIKYIHASLETLFLEITGKYENK